MKSTIISVDIGGSHLTVGAVESIELILDTMFTLPVDNNGSAHEILTTWSSAINECIDAVPNTQVVGLGIAMPGAFNYQSGVALFEDTAKYNSLYGLDIRKVLAEYLSNPVFELRFINDATAFAMGSSIRGEIISEQTTLAIVLGTGFGTALIKDHTPILTGEYVPEAGCFWHMPYKDSIADEYFSTRWLVNRYNELTDKHVKGVVDIANDYLINPYAKIVFDEFGENMSEFLRAHITNLSIRSLLFGGKIANALPLFQDALLSKLERYGLRVTLKKSDLIDEATLLGASLLFNEAIWNEIAEELPTK